MKKINLLIAGVLTLGLVACGTEETEVKTKKKRRKQKNNNAKNEKDTIK
ncbi:TPA: ABC transporter substrate-binding protein [Bacillus cereus]|nr:ABC transporter substrate-binding protein [Bacillus cereus]HDR7613426.1 ABC transporter substrate-binding protein [Bacillus mycoides]